MSLKKKAANIGIITFIVLSGLMAVGCISEFVTVGVVADPGVLKYYSFGSPCFLENGGWNYLTKEIYIMDAFVRGFIFLAIFVFLLISLIVKKFKKRLVVLSLIFYSCFMIYAVTQNYLITPISIEFTKNRGTLFLE